MRPDGRCVAAMVLIDSFLRTDLDRVAFAFVVFVFVAREFERAALA
jgi:hypothetical protein